MKQTDKFQAGIRSDKFFDFCTKQGCKTIQECIDKLEEVCGIESLPGTSWVYNLVATAKQRKPKKWR
jgi:hypothetical protein